MGDSKDSLKIPFYDLNSAFYARQNTVGASHSELRTIFKIAMMSESARLDAVQQQVINTF